VTDRPTNHATQSVKYAASTYVVLRCGLVIQLTAVRFCANTNSQVQLFIVEQLTDQSNANDKTAKTNSVETEHMLHTDHN